MGIIRNLIIFNGKTTPINMKDNKDSMEDRISTYKLVDMYFKHIGNYVQFAG